MKRNWHSSLHKINTTFIGHAKEWGQCIDGNCVGRITKAPLSSVLGLSLAQVHCCPVRMRPSIVRAVAFSAKEAENPNLYGKCPGGGNDDLAQVVRKGMFDKVTCLEESE